MRLTTTLAAAAALAVSGFAATAGGLSDEVMEAPVVAVEPEMEPAGYSISPTFIILGVLAAHKNAAYVANEDDDDDDDEPTDTIN